MNELKSELAVIIGYDDMFDSIGYYFDLPSFSPLAINPIIISDPFFVFSDSFDYGDNEHFCGGYNISGDCPTAAKIFDQFLNADFQGCVEYWGHITNKRTNQELLHEVYYDYRQGFAGGQINDIKYLSLHEISYLIKILANRLVESVGLKHIFTNISVLPVTKFINKIEKDKIECMWCDSTFNHFSEYYEHNCEAKKTLNNLYQNIKDAYTNKEKQDSLETFIKHVFTSHDGFEVVDTNIRGLDSEIDLMIINECEQKTISEMGTPILIECKHWNRSIPAYVIRDFGSKIRDRTIQTGVLVTMKGVTGSEKTDAKIALRLLRSKDGVTIIVLTEHDLIQLANGENLLQLLRKKYYEIARF